MKAFSLVEMIFVLVIMGILTFVGLEYIPDEKLTTYAQMLKQKILEKKSNALGYRYTQENNLACITFDKNWLALDESSLKVRYDFNKSYIDINVFSENDDNISTICFDYLGRVYRDSVDINLTNLLHTNIIISLKDKRKNEEKNITIYAISGSVR
jgi:prepilin-type N-terminal cleavage/methylation domain-containing protein